MIATGGTAQAISAMGVPVTPINKLGEGSPHVVDLIRERRCDLVINTPTGSGARADGYEIRTAAVRHGIPCVTTMTGATAAARAIAAGKQGDAEVRSIQEIHGASSRSADAEAAMDRPAPRPGAAPPSGAALRGLREPGLGRLPRLLRCSTARAPSRCRASSTCWPPSATGPDRASGPSCRGRSRSPRPGRRRRACGSTSWSRASVRAPTGSASWRRGSGSGSTGRSATPSRSRASWRPGAAGAILVGGGIGIAPLALLRRRFGERNVPARVLLGFRDEAHSGGLDDLFACCEVRLASEDGHAGHRGYVTDLLAAMLEGDDATSAVVYSCGPPAMLEAVRALCAERGVACELALESPMACGYGACFGCAVPKPEAATCASASTARSCEGSEPGRRAVTHA